MCVYIYIYIYIYKVPFRILWPAVEAAVKTAAPGLRALPNKAVYIYIYIYIYVHIHICI